MDQFKYECYVIAEALHVKFNGNKAQARQWLHDTGLIQWIYQGHTLPVIDQLINNI